MKYPKNSKFDYPDHTKIRMSPQFKYHYSDYSGDTSKTWEVTAGERELIDWLDQHISPVEGYSYKIPMWGKKGWCIRETREMDHNPEDYAWARINYYPGKGLIGFFLCIDDEFDNEAVQLKLSGVLERAINPRFFGPD
jgi:hypothetical protein